MYFSHRRTPGGEGLGPGVRIENLLVAGKTGFVIEMETRTLVEEERSVLRSENILLGRVADAFVI